MDPQAHDGRRAVETPEHDVFISYSRADVAQVRRLAQVLTEQAGLNVWLDTARLQPGYSWRAEVESAMSASAAAVIVWGAGGLGPVQRQERDLAYVLRDAQPAFRVLYVVLPGVAPPQGNWANVDTWIAFHSHLDEPDVFSRLVSAVKGEAPPSSLASELPDSPAPYRGLSSFGADDADLFFGRASYVDEICERLAHHPFLALLGPSGSGKTSLLHAGLVARLRRGQVKDGADWPVLTLRPGPLPLWSLASAISRLASATGEAALARIDDILGRLRARPGCVTEVVLGFLPPSSRLVLVVDRLEELFTLCESADERRAFVEACLALAHHPHLPAWVVTAMRADLYHHVGHFAELATQVTSHQVYLQPLREEDVAEVIEAPAAQVGAIFEKGLARQVRADALVGGEIALPLLQHTLDLLWQRRRGRWLTWDAYETIGRLAGALRYYADRVVDALDPAQGDIARRLLTRLVRLDEHAHVTTRRTNKASLVGQFEDAVAAERALQTLAHQRLVVLRGEGREASAELVHDTLALHWERLRGWVQQDWEFLLWRERLRAALVEWWRTDRDTGALLRGAALAEAKRWLGERARELDPDESGFVEQSVEHAAAVERAEEERHQRELAQAQALAEAERRRAEVQARARRRLRLAAAGLTLALAAALAAAFVASARQRVIDARRLAFAAESQLQADPELALLLAYEAVTRFGETGDVDYQSEQALRDAVERLAWRHVVLAGHSDELSSAVFSPDGRQILTASSDETARLWDLNGQPLRTLTGHEGPVASAAFSPSGHQVLTASADGSARVWDLGPQPPLVLGDHEAALTGAVFSPDGELILTATEDGRAWVWTLHGEVVATLVGHTGAARVATFSPDGQRILTASEDGTARLWGRDGQPLASLLGHEDELNGAYFSPDGTRVLTTADDKTARLWTLDGRLLATFRHGESVRAGMFSPDGRYVLTAASRENSAWRRSIGGPDEAPVVFAGHARPVRSLAMTADGRLLLTASDDGTARLWNGFGEALFVFAGHDAGLVSAELSPDGRSVLTASEDGTARVWREVGPPLPALLGHTDEVEAAEYNPPGDRILTASTDGTAQLWDLEGRVVTTFEGHGTPQPDNQRRDRCTEQQLDSAVFSADGRTVLTAAEDCTARLWDLDGRNLVVYHHDDQVATAVFGPGGRHVLTASDDKTARLWQRDGTWLATVSHEDEISTAVFSPDGSSILTASDDGTAGLWTLTGEPVASLAHKDSVNTAVFSHDGRQIATGSNDGVVKLWTATGTPEVKIDAHDASVQRIVFGPDDRHLATSSSDYTARLWDRDGRAVATLRGHTNAVKWVDFQPDGRRIVTASDDGTARLWDLDGRLLAIFRGHQNWVASAVFSPDGRRVLTTSRDFTARQHIVEPADLRAVAACRVERGLTAEELRRFEIDDPHDLLRNRQCPPEIVSPRAGSSGR